MSQQPKPQPIQFQRKIRNPKMITVIMALTDEWLLSPQDVVSRLINDGVNREFKRKQNEKRITA